MKKLLLVITLFFCVSLGFAQSNTRFQKSSARVTTSNMNTVTQKAVRGTRSNDPSIAGDCVVDKNGNTICILNTTQPGAKATNSTETKAVRRMTPKLLVGITLIKMVTPGKWLALLSQVQRHLYVPVQPEREVLCLGGNNRFIGNTNRYIKMRCLGIAIFRCNRR